MAESKLPIQVIISATDNVTVKVMEINQKLEKLTKPLGKLKDSFGLLSKEAGLDKLGQSFSNVGQKAGAFFGSLKSAALGLGVIVGSIAAGFKVLVKGAADSGAAVGDASKRIGVSTKFFQEFQYAASQSGIAMDSVEGILTKFSKNIGDASAGTGEAVGIFRGFGIQLKDSAGKTRSMTELLPELADKFKGIKDPALRNAVAMRLFGKEGVKMTEILQGGSERINKFAAEADKLGLIMSDDQINQASEFNNSWDKMILSIGRARDAFGAELFPVMTELFTTLTKMISDARPQIVAFAQQFAKDLPGILTQITELMKGLWSAAQTVFSIFNSVASIFGTTNTVLGIMALVIGGKVVASFLALTGSILHLGSVALPVLIRGFLFLMPIVAKLYFFLLANPLGLWIAAGAALIGLGVLLYNKWEPFRNLIDGIVDKIKSVGSFIGGAIFGGSGAAPAGAALGAQGATAAATQQIRSQTDNQITVNFDNMPKGTRVTQDKAEAPIDLSLGYSMAGG